MQELHHRGFEVSSGWSVGLSGETFYTCLSSLFWIPPYANAGVLQWPRQLIILVGKAWNGTYWDSHWAIHWGCNWSRDLNYAKTVASKTVHKKLTVVFGAVESRVWFLVDPKWIFNFSPPRHLAWVSVFSSLSLSLSPRLSLPLSCSSRTDCLHHTYCLQSVFFSSWTVMLVV